MARPIKYLEVVERLNQRIESDGFPAGGPLPPERQLAEELGVSRLTVRKALEVLTEKQAVIRRPGIGTFANPKSRRAALPGVLYVGETGTHFYERFYQALCAEAQDRGSAIIAALPGDDDPARRRQFSELVREHRRLICTEATWQQIRTLVAEDVHVTRVSGFHSIAALAADDRPGYVISTDHYRAVKLAVEHLVRLGHRQIGLLDIGSVDPAAEFRGLVNPRRETTLGYRAGLAEHGLSREWLVTIPDRANVADWQEHERQAIRGHFAQWDQLPTAFVSAFDFRVGPLFGVLRERGLRVPADVSVVGMGNTPWAETLDPPLTTICLGEQQMAHWAIVMNQEPEPLRARVVRIDPELVVRQSTAAPAAKE